MRPHTWLTDDFPSDVAELVLIREIRPLPAFVVDAALGLYRTNPTARIGHGRVLDRPGLGRTPGNLEEDLNRSHIPIISQRVRAPGREPDDQRGRQGPFIRTVLGNVMMNQHRNVARQESQSNQ